MNPMHPKQQIYSRDQAITSTVPNEFLQSSFKNCPIFFDDLYFTRPEEFFRTVSPQLPPEHICTNMIYLCSDLTCIYMLPESVIA